MRLEDVKEGELFHYARTGHGYSTDKVFLRGKYNPRDIDQIRCYQDIVNRRNSVLLWEGHEVVVIGRVYNKHITRRK